MNFPGRRTLEAAAETERMPVDAGWALAGLSAVVRAQPLNGAGAAAKLQSIRGAKVFREAAAPRCSAAEVMCSFAGVWPLFFFGILDKRIAGGSRPRLIFKKENWSCTLTGRLVFLSYTYSMSEMISRDGLPYKNMQPFTHAYANIIDGYSGWYDKKTKAAFTKSNILSI